MTHTAQGPVLLATWSFGLPAVRAAWPALDAGGPSLDAVEQAACYAEEDRANRTVGRGGRPDASGRVSLDASIMVSPARVGGVAAIRRFAQAASIARRVMEQTRHVLLAGPDADAFAESQGFASVELLTEQSQAEWERWRAGNREGTIPNLANIEEVRGGNDGGPAGARRAEAGRGGADDHDTIGILALDASGTLAGACSTSGLPFKAPGRVGDSPIPGHGLYVDPAFGAAVATGHGELIMGVCGTFLAVELLRRGADPLEAASAVIERIAQAYELGPGDQAAIIVMNRAGRFASAALRSGFQLAVRTRSRDELIPPDRVHFAGA